MKFRLPWPDPGLSPNARQRWRPLAVLKRGAREYAYWVTWNELRDAGDFAYFLQDGVSVTLTFCPPDRRRRDLDNAIAAFKASQDGIADALGVDDSCWAVTYKRGEPVKGGAVFVEVCP